MKTSFGLLHVLYKISPSFFSSSKSKWHLYCMFLLPFWGKTHGRQEDAHFFKRHVLFQNKGRKFSEIQHVL